MLIGGEEQWEISKGAASEEVLAQGKCIKQLVPNVVRNVKFLSNRKKASQFIAENVTLKEKDSNFFY